MSTDLFSLSGRRTLITGAGGVIGTELAHGMAAAGAIVTAQDITLDRAEAVGAPHALAADLSDPQACRQLVADAIAVMGGLDIVVNCAGINRRKRIDDVTSEDFDAIVAVNMRAVYFVSQAAHAALAASGHGVIVNISSLSSTHPREHTRTWNMKS
jgi:NAD(P)-dependent dehydrogenase (short-subunit alcohol dehydrogenase family)